MTHSNFKRLAETLADSLYGFIQMTVDNVFAEVDAFIDSIGSDDIDESIYTDEPDPAVEEINVDDVVTLKSELMMWNGRKARVKNIGNTILTLTPIQNRPDGYGLSDFLWMKDSVVKD